MGNTSTTCLKGMFLEVDLLEVRIHVETLGAEVVGAGDVRDHTLTLLADCCTPHPHVPVPLLKEEEDERNKQTN